MALPPKSKKKKKRKKVVKKKEKKDEEEDYGQEESESEEDEVDDDDDEIDKLIAKKFPDFKTAVQIINELKKIFPQTGINGEKNIWIIKPAQSSRGRGIELKSSLIEIMEIAK